MRVVCFIDGFNVYHSLNDRKGLRHRFKWLDLHALASQFLEPGDTLEQVLYFTAYSWDLERKKRHTIYIEALSKRGVRPVIGSFKRVRRHFVKDKMKIAECSLFKPLHWLLPKYLQYWTFEEKETDVNLSVFILDYAYRDMFDKAFVITGDTDIKPAIDLVKNRFPQKIVQFIFPIGRKNKDLEIIAGLPGKLITTEHLKDCQFPETVQINSERAVTRPNEWKPI